MEERKMELPKVDFPESLAERLRTQREQYTDHTTEQTFRVPGFRELYARYLPLDYRTARRIVERCATISDPATRDLEAAAASLIAACQGVEAHIDGEVHDLGCGFGKQLADKLGFEGSETDCQALFLLFPSEMAVITEANRVKDMVEEPDEDEMLKNSQAAV
jgi:hypothetical protein